MIVEIFAFCDSAHSYNGKLCILGAFDTITARSKPITYPSFAIALRLRFQKSEVGHHSLHLDVIDADGRQVANPLDIRRQFLITEGNSTAAFNIILNYQNVNFSDFGDYAINLAVDGKQQASLPIKIVERGQSVVSSRT